MDISKTDEQKLKSGINLALVVYALQIAGFFLGGVTSLIGIIVNYVKRSDVQGTYIASHFTWQIRTFWYGLLWTVIGFLLIFVYIGFAVLFVNFIWMMYRIIKGLLRLNDRKPMYQ